MNTQIQFYTKIRMNLLAKIKRERENRSICVAFLSISHQLKHLGIGAAES